MFVDRLTDFGLFGFLHSLKSKRSAAIPPPAVQLSEQGQKKKTQEIRKCPYEKTWRALREANRTPAATVAKSVSMATKQQNSQKRAPVSKQSVRGSELSTNSGIKKHFTVVFFKEKNNWLKSEIISLIRFYWCGHCLCHNMGSDSTMQSSCITCIIPLVAANERRAPLLFGVSIVVKQCSLLWGVWFRPSERLSPPRSQWKSESPSHGLATKPWGLFCTA